MSEPFNNKSSSVIYNVFATNLRLKVFIVVYNSGIDKSQIPKSPRYLGDKACPKINRSPPAVSVEFLNAQICIFKSSGIFTVIWFINGAGVSSFVIVPETVATPFVPCIFAARSSLNGVGTAFVYKPVSRILSLLPL